MSSATNGIIQAPNKDDNYKFYIKKLFCDVNLNMIISYWEKH